MKRSYTRCLGDVIADFVQESQLKDGLLRVRIYAAWDAMTLGQVSLGEYTSHHSFRDGVLTCRIRSSVVRSHLQLQAGLLCDRLNAALCGEYVKSIRLT